MKKMIIVLTVLALAFAGCKKCKNEDPRARVVNNGTENVSVHIQTTGGNTININNIDPASSSDFESYADGEVDFTITVGNGNNTTEYTYIVNMEECYEYDIIIDINNNIVSVPTDRND